MISYFSIFFLIKITTALFPNHLDLQKVGVVILNNEKYNILKPTIHQVTDHFKDFMLRRGNNRGTLFLDDNGFRHVWSNFGEDLRRADTTKALTKAPTKEPTKIPTKALAKEPTKAPTKTPPKALAKETTKAPTKASAKEPTKAPTKAPAKEPTKAPTKEPTKAPTKPSTAKSPTAVGTGDKIKGRAYFFCPFLGVITMNAFVES